MKRRPEIITLYLLRVGESDIYKIGHTSRNIKERMYNLKQFVPDIKIVDSCRCNGVIEKQLQEQFNHKRGQFDSPFQGYKEFFKLGQNDVDYVLALMQELKTKYPQSIEPLRNKLRRVLW